MGKDFFKEWCIITGFLFIMYDVLWMLIDYRDFMSVPDDKLIEVTIDFIFCGIFAFSSLGGGRLMYGARWWNHIGIMKFGIALHLLFNIIIAIGLLWVLEMLLPSETTSDFWSMVYLFCVISSLSSMFFTLRRYYSLVLRQNEEKINLQKQYLKLQLDPHFVFNNFSVLSEMIVRTPTQAEKYVVLLSKTYRYMLRSLDKDFISIKEAMAVVSDYVALLNLRYENNIILETDLNPTRDTGDCLLSMSLQLTIENAVKHNRPDNENKLYIRIFKEEEKYLVIANNLIGKRLDSKRDTESFCIGIENLKQRYLLEWEKEPIFEETDGMFKAKLPILRNLS